MASLNAAKQQLRSAMKQRLGAITHDLALAQSRQPSGFPLLESPLCRLNLVYGMLRALRIRLGCPQLIEKLPTLC